MFMTEDQQALTKDSLELYKREEREQATFHDFAFIVFPFPKAHEGFLNLDCVKTG